MRPALHDECTSHETPTVRSPRVGPHEKAPPSARVDAPPAGLAGDEGATEPAPSSPFAPYGSSAAAAAVREANERFGAHGWSLELRSVRVLLSGREGAHNERCEAPGCHLRPAPFRHVVRVRVRLRAGALLREASAVGFAAHDDAARAICEAEASAQASAVAHALRSAGVLGALSAPAVPQRW